MNPTPESPTIFYASNVTSKVNNLSLLIKKKKKKRISLLRSLFHKPCRVTQCHQQAEVALQSSNFVLNTTKGLCSYNHLNGKRWLSPEFLPYKPNFMQD